MALNPWHRRVPPRVWPMQSGWTTTGTTTCGRSLASHLPTSGVSELGQLLAFSGQMASDLKSRFAAPSPYVIDPVLRPDKSGSSDDGECVCSFPSSHAADSAAARTFLAGLRTAPGLLRRWEAEIDYSRLYVAGHIPSDIRAGALLGDMIGEYFLVTRGHETVPATG